MEKDKTDTVNKIKAEHFGETLKLTNIVQNLQRQLDQRNAQESGERSISSKSLKDEFPNDLITRVPKGVPGADIIHIVKHNGKECGKIVYDSKNRKAWRDDYATKLRADQIAAKADHAILSICKFPAGAHQLAICEDVIVANPARVPMLAWIFRRDIIQTFSLRIAGKECDGKTAALYTYIMSERFRQLLKSIENFADKFLGHRRRRKESS